MTSRSGDLFALRRPLVGKPRRAILQDVDDSAALETRFLQQPLHDDIVGMGVDANKAHTKDGTFYCGDNRLKVLDEYCGWCNWVLDVADGGEQVISRYVPPVQCCNSFYLLIFSSVL